MKRYIIMIIFTVPLITGAATPLTMPGMIIDDSSIRDASGEKRWHVTMDISRGAKAALAPDGAVVLGGQTYGESSISLIPAALPADFVLETRIILSRPEYLGSCLFFISPRLSAMTAADKPRAVDGPAGAGYRIVYRFLGPTKFANNNTGFFLFNTADPEDRKSLNGKPLAGAPFAMEYGSEYITYTSVRNEGSGVRIRFFIAKAGGTIGATPFIDHVDTGAAAIRAPGEALLQVGSVGLHLPAPQVKFSLRIVDDSTIRSAMTSPLPATSAWMPAWSNMQRTELPNVFSDRMVLQQGKPIRVWGKGIDGDTVTVTIGGKTANAKVENGAWRVELPQIKAGGPHTLTVKASDRTIEVKDILIGEVWVLGGQSNMGWYLSDSTDVASEIASGDFPSIRIFAGWHPAGVVPQFHMAGGTWKAVHPDLKGAFSAVGYYMAKEIHRTRNVPVGLLQPSVPATGIETWMSEKALLSVYPEASASRDITRTYGDPSCFFNGKVAPLMPFSLAGFIWYQGEGTPPERGLRYRSFLPALIDDWRSGFSCPDAAFLIVQLPNYRNTSPEIREAQLMTAQNGKNAGCAVTIDVGDSSDIHPRNKRPVGERLALLARAIAYGENVVSMGPLFSSIEVKDGKAYLSFTHTNDGIVLRGEGGFEICGADMQYTNAQASVTDDGRIAVWQTSVKEPLAVRYAWANDPKVTLFSRTGLPASPFRTRE